MLDRITPVLLTYNEQANIGRTLDRLRWAKRVVVLDSLSSDQTVAICRSFPNVTLRGRAFDTHQAQWNDAIHGSEVDTEWVLALDADYLLSDALIEELTALQPPADVVGYQARFRYCMNGKPLRGSLYPPVTVLYRLQGADYRQDGHTQRIVLRGTVGELQSPILHDDRKPFAAWLRAQQRYARQEAQKLRGCAFAELPLQDKVRRVPLLSVPMVLGYTLLAKGCLLDGVEGLTYAGQRALAEGLLGMNLLFPSKPD